METHPLVDATNQDDPGTTPWQARCQCYLQLLEDYQAQWNKLEQKKWECHQRQFLCQMMREYLQQFKLELAQRRNLR